MDLQHKHLNSRPIIKMEKNLLFTGDKNEQNLPFPKLPENQKKKK